MGITYEGTPPGSVFRLDGVRRLPLVHRAHHSPDGFAWGYSGSGPADLARSLLIDVVGPIGADPGTYQAFKDDVVSKWPQDGSWTITASDIRRWVLKALA